MPIIKENVYTDITIEKEVFKVIDGKPLHIEIFKPEGWQEGDNRPSIIFYFGGGFYKGDTSHFRMQAEYFAHIGMVCFTPEYRLTTEPNVEIVDCLKDGKAALRYVGEHANRFGIDHKRIVVSGGSAGGAQAACSALVTSLDEANESSIPCAMVLFNPGINFGQDQMSSLPKGTMININGKMESVEDMMSHTNKMNAVSLAEYSPRCFICEGLPPTCIITGEADIAVSLASMKVFQEEYKQYGNICELISYPNRNHGFFNWNSSEEHVCYYDALHVMESFLRRMQILNPGLRSSYEY